MFGIGFFEILVIAVLGLLVFGPEKLPDAIRTFVIGFTKAKRTWTATRRELEQELGMDEIRREIHNAQVMADMEKIKAVQNLQQTKTDIEENMLESSLFDPENEENSIVAPEQKDDQIDKENTDLSASKNPRSEDTTK